MLCFDLLILFFFFKQKTAYEMRISDWSSDVCSSDLRIHERLAMWVRMDDGDLRTELQALGLDLDLIGYDRGVPALMQRARSLFATVIDSPGGAVRVQTRSEEHTSELQSLLRISYAVFCLKKKMRKYYIVKRL